MLFNDTGSGAIKESPYAQGAYGAPFTIGSGFLNTYGVAVDAGGNVFVGDTDNKQVKELPTSRAAMARPRPSARDSASLTISSPGFSPATASEMNAPCSTYVIGDYTVVTPPF